MTPDSTELSLPDGAPLVVSLLRAGRAVRVRARGTSMAPAIGDGDFVQVTPGGGAFTPGEVVLVLGPDGRLRAHRVVAVGAEGVFTEGDAVGVREGPFAAADVLGRVTQREVDGEVREVPAIARVAVRGVHRFGLPAACAALGGSAALLRGASSFEAAAVIAVAVGTGMLAARTARRRDLGVAASAAVSLSPAVMSRVGRHALPLSAGASAWLGLEWIVVEMIGAAWVSGLLARTARARRGRIPVRAIALAVIAVAVLGALLRGRA